MDSVQNNEPGSAHCSTAAPTCRYLGYVIPTMHFADKLGGYWRTIIGTLLLLPVSGLAAVVAINALNGWCVTEHCLRA